MKFASDEFQRIVKESNSSEYYHLLDMRILDLKKGRAELHIKLGKKHEHVFKEIHGGVISSIIDAAAGAAALSLRPMNKVATAEIAVNYFRPVKSGEIVSRASVLNKSSKTVTTQVRVSHRRKLIAVGICTMVFK